MSALDQPQTTPTRCSVALDVRIGSFLVVGALGVALFAFLWAGARAAPLPSIWPDEYVYAQLQRSFALHGHFAFLGHPFSAWSYGPAFLLILAPLARLGLSPLALYHADQVVACLLYASAVIPAYLLSRRLLSHRAAVGGAALLVALPSSFLATRLMTESFGYPVFLWLLLACWRALESPSRRRRLGVLALIAFAVTVRAEFAAFAPAYVGAELALRYRGRAWIAALGAVPILLLGAPLLPHALSGLHHGALVGNHQLLRLPQWTLFNLIGVELYVGVAPVLAAALAFRQWLTGDDRRRRSFAVLSLSCSLWLGVLVGVYVSRRSEPTVYDRYTFYLAAPLLLGFLGWIADGMPRSRRRLLGLCLPLAAAPLLLPYWHLFVPQLMTYILNVGLLPLYGFQQQAGWVAFYVGLALFLLLACLLVARVSRDRPGYLVLVTLLALAVSGALARGANQLAAADGVNCLTRTDWVDRQLPPGADAVLIVQHAPGGLPHHCELGETLFANQTITAVYRLGGKLLPGLPEPQLHRARSGVLQLPTGAVVTPRFAVSDRPLRGTLLARERHGLSLYRIDGVVSVPSRGGRG
jgi:Dolichyl-phosphate-mannose-protein mannosyltransferase